MIMPTRGRGGVFLEAGGHLPTRYKMSVWGAYPRHTHLKFPAWGD